MTTKLPAIFFLTLYLVLSLHDVFPHIHHSHDFNEVSVKHHDHESQDHQHKDNKDPEHKGIDDFILFFLTHHTHSYQMLDSVDLIQKDWLMVNNDSIQAIGLDELNIIPKPGNQNLHRYSLFKLGYHDNPHPLTNSQRGPPALG